MRDLAEAAAAGAAPGRWGDLRLRLLSAMALGPLALGCLWVGGAAWAVMILALFAGLLREWWRLWPRLGAAPALTGFAWMAAAAAALIWLREDPVCGRANMLLLVVVVWSSDIGAYLCGRTIGGRRLAPRWSPGKTWAGAVGGLLAAALVGGVLATVTGSGQPAAAAALALVLSLLAQIGDMIESITKRYAGVKDSGGLIPGHGGLLDRLDGMLAASVPAALLALVLGRGVFLWQ